MTQIDTITAEDYWDDECNYLDTIGFVSIEHYGDDRRPYISLATDEEINDDIILTKDAAIWLAKQLRALAKQLHE